MATTSVSQEEYGEDGPYPPTPGAPSDMEAENDGDITMLDIGPAQASTGSLPTPEGQDGIANIDTDVEMSEEVHVEPDATVGAERAEQTDIEGAGDDPAEHTQFVTEDVVMEENSVVATQNTEIVLTEQHKQTKPRKGEGAQSQYQLPPLPFPTPAAISHASPIVEIPAPSVPLAAAPAIEAKASNTKSTKKDLANKSGNINKTGKSSQGPAGKSSADQHKGAQNSTPSTPPGIQKHNHQVSAAPSPTVTASPLSQLKRSVMMGRKSSFSEAQASSTEAVPKPKPKGKVSGKTGIISLEDADLIDDFVFMSQREVDKMWKAPELRNHIRGIESLRLIHNGVTKPAMIEHYMKWQHRMQALKNEKAEAAAKTLEPSQAGGLGSEEPEEEEEEDIDAEGSTDEEFYEAQESPVTGKVTPGPPLKSPFTDQPRSSKESPFVAKLTAAGSSPSVRRRASRSRTPEMEGQNEPDIYKKFEKEEEMERKKRMRRSASRPASYKV